MRQIRGIIEAWLKRERTMLDLCALGLLAIAAKAYGWLAVGGILAVLLLAALTDGEWFKRR